MDYLVTDEPVAGLDWTADELAQALKAPLAKIGITVKRVQGYGEGGFQATGLSAQAYKAKFDEVGWVVRDVIRTGPLTN